MGTRFETRGQETKAVKEALQKAGINARVTHGKGTAWGWLQINIGAGQDFGEHEKGDRHTLCRSDCPRCVGIRSMRSHTFTSGNGEKSERRSGLAGPTKKKQFFS
jgi:hypothetical protein